MKRNVFDPLGMVHTQVYDDHERLVRNRAYSYRRGGDGAWIKSVLSYANRGATSLFTTAGDSPCGSATIAAAGSAART
jgi:CubicO group peptidase (beta-lactamase class C family)